MANQWVEMTRGKFKGQRVPIKKGPPEMRPAGIRVYEPRVNPGPAEDRNATVPKYAVLFPEILGIPKDLPCWVRAEECKFLSSKLCRDLDLQHNLPEVPAGGVIVTPH